LVEQGDGYLRNLTLNTKGADHDYLGGRIALRLLPTDSVTWDLSADFSRDISYGTDPLDTAGILTPKPASLFDTRTGIIGISKGRSYGFQSTVNWSASEAVSIESITAWRTATQDIPHDVSGQPVSLYFFDDFTVSHQFSEELKLNADLTSRLRLVAGLYYFDEDSRAKDNQFQRADPTAAQVSYLRNLTVNTKSYAAFGQLELGLTDTLKVVAAGRFTHDEKTLDIVQTSSNPAALFNFTDESTDALGTDFDPKRTFNRFTPKLGVNWQVSPDTLLYASWTKGFRSGGWTGRALRADQFRNFDPETVSSYEVGSKLTLLDRRLRFNTSAFYMDYANLFNTLTIAGAYTVQLANARMYGVETEITGRVASWIDLYVTGGYLNARYKGQRPVNLADRLQRAPATQGKVGFDVHYPVGEGKLLANAGLFYSSEYYVSAGNLGFSAPLLPIDSNLVRSFAVADGMLGYEFGDDGRYRLSVSCTNCFNREYIGSVTAIGRYAAIYPAPPRFYKVSASARF
jgi:iron complex outermembrane receptor protein